MSDITAVVARQVFDSRGRPTVEVDVTTSSGHVGRAAVPSGASTGTSEAWELRDGDPEHYAGLGVTSAVAHVHDEIAPALTGHPVSDQRGIDSEMLQLDGTPQLSRLGANAILGVSLAVCRASALTAEMPLHRRIAELAGVTTPSMPMPMVNILSGGLHARSGMDVQDFLMIPASARDTNEALAMVGAVRTAATEVMQGRGLSTLLADEGGLSPGLRTSEAALELMVESFVAAGLQPGRDAVIAVDVAATTLWDDAQGAYRLPREDVTCTARELIERYVRWIDEFPVISIEDPLHEEDWENWPKVTEAIGNRCRIIGDDLFTTNSSRLRRGISEESANGILVKVNQNGTLTGTLDVIEDAHRAGFAPVVSARSGETEDSFISDLAVGTAAGQIKIGSVRCSDRLAKYNQLVRISEDSSIGFAGMSAVTVGDPVTTP
ncbi:phosphopyruvate hydratase [Rhodococcus sp. NPDC057014]|uniref:phosphopyruvate hydratase n=1 Tax=Rhodococcus sp. NPDC057014 TaxID=3346000 RepID=UPI003640D208